MRSTSLLAAMAAACLAGPVSAADAAAEASPSRPPARPAARATPGPRPAAPGPATPLPPATLGDFGPQLEGTWELESMTLPDGTKLQPPVASGVIVVDRGAYLAAAYVQPGGTRRIGNIWEGRLVITGGTFRLEPKVGYRYDSGAEFQVVPEMPPAVAGTVERTADGVVFEKAGGGTVTHEARSNRRVQQDPDGTLIVHVRTSLVPRIPEDLPGRATPSGR